MPPVNGTVTDLGPSIVWVPVVKTLCTLLRKGLLVSVAAPFQLKSRAFCYIALKRNHTISTVASGGVYLEIQFSVVSVCCTLSY